MTKAKCAGILLVAVLVLFIFSGVSLAADDVGSLVNVQKYNRAIHIMAMLIVGFGFLMVFVKKYGRSAVTATYLLVSVALPLYMVINSLGIFGAGNVSVVDGLILAEFAAASLLICAGAVLGRLKMIQYIILGMLFVPFYMVNEWIVLKGGFGLIPAERFVDTGGSIVIHAFGALFGLAVAMTMTTEKEFSVEIEADSTSDRFSMLGSMVLWFFWPSFCAALVSPELVPVTGVNVILALCGATLATYFSSAKLRGKMSIADIANASLAGGVAIGATCAVATPAMAFVIGVFAGVLSTFGFAVIQPKLQEAIKKIDTCGVLNLHGLPGLAGGIIALFVVSGISARAQMTGILVSILIAVVTGFLTGKVVSFFGRRKNPYLDAEEFLAVED